jgi:hypothetical protein
MNYTVKLLIPIGLGIAAAVINWMAISARTRPIEFTTVARAFKVGETITTDELQPVEVPAHLAARLMDTAIPYKEKGTLSGQVVLRQLEPGDLILWQDKPIEGPRIDWQERDQRAVTVPLSGAEIPPIRVGDWVSFLIPVPDEHGRDVRRWVGPFRLVTVGDQRTFGAAATQRFDHVTVAFPDRLEEKHLVLQKFIQRRLEGEDLLLGISIDR